MRKLLKWVSESFSNLIVFSFKSPFFHVLSLILKHGVSVIDIFKQMIGKTKQNQNKTNISIIICRENRFCKVTK